MSDDEPRTTKAIRECADFLRKCLTFGWTKDDLDRLEALWWQHHDHRGQLIESIADTSSDLFTY